MRRRSTVTVVAVVCIVLMASLYLILVPSRGGRVDDGGGVFLKGIATVQSDDVGTANSA